MTLLIGAFSDSPASELPVAPHVQIIEVPTLPGELLKRISRSCREHGIALALSTETSAPTGPDFSEAESAVVALADAVEQAEELSARHITVRFPSPRRPVRTEDFAPLAESFLETAAAAARETGVRVLIRNEAANVLCRHAAHYADLLTQWPELGVCLDIGQCRLAGGESAVRDFADRLGDRIVAVRLCDRVPAGSGPATDQSVDALRSAINRRVIEDLVEVGHLESILLSHEASIASVDTGTARWLSCLAGRQPPGLRRRSRNTPS